MGIIRKRIEDRILGKKTIYEKFAKEIEESKYPVIACKINREVRPLDYYYNREDKIELVDISSKTGIQIYSKGLVYIFGKAIKRLCPDSTVLVKYQLNNGIYIELENTKITQKLIDDINNEMKRIVEKKLPIKKVRFNKRDGKKFYEQTEMVRGKLQFENKEKKNISLYYCEDYNNYFYGVLPINTEILSVFKVEKYENGLVVRCPNMKHPTKLDTFDPPVKLQAAMQEYDNIHRVLGIKNVYQLNAVVRRGNAVNMVLLDEALHEKKVAECAQKIANDKNKKLVLIAGPSSSGKTTFSKRLFVQLRVAGLKAVRISVDNYFVDRDQTPIGPDGKPDFECIEAIDLKLFNSDMKKLIEGKEIDVPTFDFKKGVKVYNGNKLKLEDDEIIVMEGIHCLNDRLTSEIPKENKFKIYASALASINLDNYNRISSSETRVIRRIARDYKFRGYSAKRTLENWEAVTKGEEKNIFPFQENVDFLFNTSLVFEISALKNIVIPLLDKVDKKDDVYPQAKRLRKFLEYFEPIDKKLIFSNSLLREFIGGSIFGDE